jgi:HAD superfamily hydrolase (TIGR01549 family)
MTKRAILFDLDGTILLDRHSPIETFLSYCSRLGHALNGDTPTRLERWQLEYWARHDEVEARIAEQGREKFWINYTITQLNFLEITGPLDEHALKIDKWFREEYVYEGVVPDDVRPTLTRLKAGGAVIGLVSNRMHALTKTVEEHNLTGLFDFTLAAGEAGAWKPKPRIFEIAVQMAGVEAANATYVGDNYYADILGAQGAGLTPILIDRRGLFPEAECRVIKSIGELEN